MIKQVKMSSQFFNMQEDLECAERDMMSFLSPSRDDEWTSLDIMYSPPRVHRLRRDLPEGKRLYLHKIFAADLEQVLYHPHPWPSIVHVLRGTYAHCIGYGKPGQTSNPPIIMRQIVSPGTIYEMTDPLTWHSVAPINFPCLTIMVTGKPYQHKEKKQVNRSPELSDRDKASLLSDFRSVWDVT